VKAVLVGEIMQRARIPLSLVKDPGGEPVSDVELGSALIRGLPWAQVETWNRFSPIVLRMAVSVLGAGSDVHDVVQEVFCRLLRKARTLRNPECLHPFVISFAIRVLKSELRVRRVRSWLSFHEPENLPEVAVQGVDLEARDLLRRFYALLGHLRARQRLVYTLRNVELMTIEQTAVAMDISIATVKRLQKQATQEVAHLLENDRELLDLLSRKGRHDA
jgi:RNA polymerase sigma factor (sigma-70 family)